MALNPYEFPHSIHVLRASAHMLDIDPSKWIITVPYDDWWRLWTEIDRRYSYKAVGYDGRGIAPTQFQFMGITFKAASESDN
jgi:hypothetical protein